jgi:acetylornithine deacetylase/succinyl-diaminopimelate desuccinylase-like protein
MATEVPAELTGATTELLQQLIRNACVNDGRPESGEEVRNAELLSDHLDHPALELQHFEPVPGRRSLLATLEGTDPSAPTVLLLGHTDVVPVTADAWRRDPFGGELVDGEVWGRGAVDMLNLTASMAVALRTLAEHDHRPRATVRFLGIADEEAGGVLGAEWVTEHHWDDVACDYVLTESGGLPFPTASGTKLVMASAEKGIGWRRLTVHGTPGHGSMPYGTDNALVTAAEVIRRLQAYEPRATITEHWEAWARALDVDDVTRAALLDPDRLDATLPSLDPRLAGYCHAITHTTFSPNVIHGGVKTNVIPDRVELEVDIRTLPGVDAADVDAMLAEALGDLAAKVTVTPGEFGRPASASPSDTPMFDLLAQRASAAHSGAEVLPWMIVGGTDAAFFRRRGVPSYGAGLFSPRASLMEFRSRFHGHDERIDVASLGLSTQLWIDVADGLAPTR